MVTPVNVARSAPTGTILYAGRTAASEAVTPAWAVSSPLNAWMAVPNTAGCNGASVDPWGGFPIRDENGIVQIVFLAAGGHTNSNDNRVVSLDLHADSPGWSTRVTPSLIPFNDSIETGSETVNNYYSWDVTKGDNPKPGSSHLYSYVYWSKYAQKYVRVSATGTYISGGTSACIDTIAPVDTGGGIWHWDAPGTNPKYPYSSNGAGQACGNPNDGYIWTSGYRWRPGQATWTAQSVYTGLRFPSAYDAGRDCIFNVQLGDGQDMTATTLQAKQTFLTAGTTRTITFNASAALTKFMADKPDYAGMDYDPVNDQYLFYYDRYKPGVWDFQGVIIIKPNPTAVWDMTIFTPAGGGVTPGRTPTDGSGINGRIKYSPTLKGFVLIPKGSDGVYFMRTS